MVVVNIVKTNTNLGLNVVLETIFLVNNVNTAMFLVNAVQTKMNPGLQVVDQVQFLTSQVRSSPRWRHSLVRLWPACRALHC